MKREMKSKEAGKRKKSGSPVAVGKSSSKAKTSKSVNVATAVKSSEPAAANDRPTLESILEEADRAFTDVVRKYLSLAEAYVKAVTFYGAKGRMAFRTRFPLTDNALRNLELVGRGRLLPQFAMCSNRFVKGLVDMADSLTWQYKLLGASKNGYIRIRINGNVVDAKFEDLKSDKLVNGVLSVVSDADKDLTPEQICDKLCKLRSEVRANFDKKRRPLYAIDPAKKTVRFFKAKPLTADDLRKIVAQLED